MKLPAHKCGLYLAHNEHRDVYETAAGWLDHMSHLDWENEAAKQRAIASDEIWVLHWYPNTPVSFYALAAPTLEELLRYAETHEAVEM